MGANTFELPKTSVSTTMEGIDTLFGNDAVGEAYSMFRI